jgi:anti-sigma factor RsiW
LIVQEAVSNHVRSLLVTHLTDVVSTDQHTVKPWFTGKLDYSPPVVNLTEAGFPLIGGRLDFLDNRPVSAIVYQRRKHIINLFIWPAGPNEMLPETYDTGKGFHIRAWRNGQMNYMAVSEVAEADLAEFCGLIQAQTK